jgi:hypothetical protein
MMSAPGQSSGRGLHPPGVSNPPYLSPPSRLHPAWWLAACLLVLAAARGLQHFAILLPPCGLRTLTGIPCLFCGSTRCLVAWSHFRVGEAFRLNPLVAAGYLALLGWILLALRDSWLQQDRAARMSQRLLKKPWPILFGLAALANWVYLLVRLPR